MITTYEQLPPVSKALHDYSHETLKALTIAMTIAKEAKQGKINPFEVLNEPETKLKLCKVLLVAYARLALGHPASEGEQEREITNAILTSASCCIGFIQARGEVMDAPTLEKVFEITDYCHDALANLDQSELECDVHTAPDYVQLGVILGKSLREGSMKEVATVFLSIMFPEYSTIKPSKRVLH